MAGAKGSQHAVGALCESMKGMAALQQALQALPTQDASPCSASRADRVKLPCIPAGHVRRADGARGGEAVTLAGIGSPSLCQ